MKIPFVKDRRIQNKIRNVHPDLALAEDNPELPSTTESEPLSTKLPETQAVTSDLSMYCFHSAILHRKSHL